MTCEPQPMPPRAWPPATGPTRGATAGLRACCLYVEVPATKRSATRARRSRNDLHHGLLALAALLGLAALAPAGDGDGGSGRAAAVIDLRDWDALRSPFYRTRRVEERRLRHLPTEEGRVVALALMASPDARFRKAAASWVAATLAAGGEFDAARLSDALEAESDPAVRDAWEVACARHPDAMTVLRDRFAAGRVPGSVLDRIVDARLLVLLGRVMHDGTIPGFFDGQFAEVHALDPTVYGRLAHLAWNPRVHFVIRALSVMALHEPKREDLPDLLAELLIDAADEVGIQKEFEIRAITRRLDDAMIQRVMRANLSQYARFSLAKAGVAGPIQRKIAYMDATVTQKLRLIEALGIKTTRDDGSADWEFEDAMSTVFEIGYHYQQLDAYDLAEAAYRRVLDRPEPVRSKRWAHYNMACIRAIQGRNDDAIDHLAKAFEAGLPDPAWALRDGDLEPLRDDERFQKLIADRLAQGPGG